MVTLCGAGKIEAAILQRGLDALAAFLHGDVGQAHDVEDAPLPGADVHLDFDQVGVDPKHRCAERFEEHGVKKSANLQGRQTNAKYPSKLETSWILRASAPAASHPVIFSAARN